VQFVRQSLAVPIGHIRSVMLQGGAALGFCSSMVGYLFCDGWVSVLRCGRQPSCTLLRIGLQTASTAAPQADR